MEGSFSIALSPSVLISAAIIVVASIAWLIIGKSYRRYIEKPEVKGRISVRKASLLRTIHSAVRYLLVLVAIMGILQVNGVDVGALAASLGIAGIIVGLALQDTLKDVIMGTHIVTDQFFKVGDVVRLNGTEGEVVSFTPQTTRIRSLVDNSVTSLCNRNITEMTVVSTFGDIEIPLSRTVDVRQARKVLEGACAEISATEGVESCEFKGTQRFSDSAIVYLVRILCPPLLKPDLLRAAREIIQRNLADADIELCIGQIEVHQQEMQ